MSVCQAGAPYLPKGGCNWLAGKTESLLAGVDAGRHTGQGPREVHVHMGAVGTGLQTYAGQQPGAGLVSPALCGAGFGLLGLPLRVMAARLLHQLAQRLGLRCGAQAEQGAGCGHQGDAAQAARDTKPHGGDGQLLPHGRQRLSSAARCCHVHATRRQCRR